jgi:hypothetical protein
MDESGFTREQLADKALLALQEIASAHKEGPWPYERTLRSILALLYRGGETWPYKQFLEAATLGSKGEVLALSFGRYQTMRSAYAAIAREWGRDFW